MMFHKSLQDVVKGIRSHKHNLAPYISTVISEIKNELTINDDDTKSIAIEKLTYLQLEGYDMSWANFNIVEVMSMPWFGHRHVGYLAASQAFTQTTDVILLTTHLFRKAFSPNTSDPHVMYETGAAITCLANICNKDLAMALLKDVYGMLNSSRPYTRKKAVLVLYKLFQAWPKALRLSFPRLREKLQDKDPSVRSAAVYVVCELARNNPKNYLSLAPEFFKILTTSSNNWILIKIVKLLGSLVPLEPRLAKKLRDPLHDIITTTPAKSLLYECINTLISGKLTSKSVVSLCMEKLRTFIEDPDQNLKYLGLLGLHKLMKQHLRVVAEHKDVILDCLEDEDPTIRRRAIDIITRMVSRKNINGIVRRLLQHLKGAEGDYRNYVMGRIIQICSQENFAFISDFAWYVETLLQLTVMVGTNEENSVALKGQFIDVVVRVRGVRRFAVKHLARLLQDKEAANSGALTNTALSEVLFAAAWAVGEYPDMIKDPLELLKTILDPAISRLNPNTQVVYLHAALKICAYVLGRLAEESNESPDYVPPQAAAPAAEATTGVHADPKSTGTIVDVMGLIEDSKEDQKVDEDNDEDDDENINLEIKSKVEDDSKSPKNRVMQAGDDWRSVARDIMETLTSKLDNFVRSNDVEVQERAVCYQRFISALLTAPTAEEIEQKDGAKPEKLDLLSLSKADATAAINQVIDFFGVSDSDKLGLVHPKAQKRVKVPQGLDLEKWINEPESDSDDDLLDDKKDYENQSWDDLEDFLGGGKKKKGKKGKKGKKDKEEREKNLRAIKAKREKDPFYLKGGDDSDDEKRVDVNDIPIKDLGDEFDLGFSKKKKKKKGKRQRKVSDPDLPAEYEVAAGPTLDGDDTDEEDERKRQSALDVDISTPLQEDEVIPEVGSYGDPNLRPQRKAEGKSSKKSKKDKKGKKKKDKKKKDRRKRDDSQPASPAPVVSNILDIGASPAKKPEKVKAKAEPIEYKVAPAHTRNEDDYELEEHDAPLPEGISKKSKKDKKKKDKKHKKDKKKKKEKSEKSGSSSGPTIMNLLDGGVSSNASDTKSESKVASVPQSLFTTSAPEFRKQLLYRDNAFCVYFTTRSDASQYDVLIDLYMVSMIKKLDIARVELENKYEGTMEQPNPSKPIHEVSSLRNGKPKTSSVSIEWKTFDKPRVIPVTIYYQIPGTKMIRQMCGMTLGCSAMLLPTKKTMDDLSALIKGGNLTHHSSTNITLREISMQEALKAVSGILNVQLVKAVAGAATYYGKSDRNPPHHVIIRVKAKRESKKKLTVDVKASASFLPSALCQQLAKAMADLPSIP